MRSIRWLVLIPAPGLLAGPFLHGPALLGLPFLLGWTALWIVASVAVLAVVYRFDPANRSAGPEGRP